MLPACCCLLAACCSWLRLTASARVCSRLLAPSQAATGAKLQRALAAGSLPRPSASLVETAAPSLPPPLAACLVAMANAGLPVATLRAVAADDVEADPLRALAAVAELHSMPRPADFFAEHVLPSRPAVLRGLVDTSSFPPLRDFPDFDYLRRRCGTRRVPVKSLALDDKDGRPVFVRGLPSSSSLSPPHPPLALVILPQPWPSSLPLSPGPRCSPPQVSDPELKMVFPDCF